MYQLQENCDKTGVVIPGQFSSKFLGPVLLLGCITFVGGRTAPLLCGVVFLSLLSLAHNPSSSLFTSGSIPEQNVACCISASCKQMPNSPADAYSCMNTENSKACLGGFGEFVP